MSTAAQRTQRARHLARGVSFYLAHKTAAAVSEFSKAIKYVIGDFSVFFGIFFG
jgi:hypothetical protein